MEQNNEPRQIRPQLNQTHTLWSHGRVTQETNGDITRRFSGNSPFLKN